MKERKDHVISFFGFFNLFSGCCAWIFYASQKTENVLAACGELLFLYELEREAYVFYRVFYDCDLALRIAAGQMQGAGKVGESSCGWQRMYQSGHPAGV